MIDNQSLTAKMYDWDNRKDEGSYYECLHSEKGYEFLASELNKLHRNDDIEKARWLLCIQPDCIEGIDLCASQSFINWIVDYAKSNGIRSSNQEDTDDYWYLVTYTPGGYEVILTGFDGKDSDISEFQSVITATRLTSVDEILITKEMFQLFNNLYNTKKEIT